MSAGTFCPDNKHFTPGAFVQSSSNYFQHESWSSRLAFLFAIIGAAVGLGNLWRFPYIAGENGGGAFVMIYLVIVFIIGIPLMIAELAIGRQGRQSAVTTVQNLSREYGAGRGWMAIGWFSVLAPLLALSFYGVIAAWSLQYILFAFQNTFSGMSPDDASTLFDNFISSPVRMILWQTLFVAATALVIGRGVRRGIEKVAKLFMPALFVLLVILVLYANIAGAAGESWRFLFNVDFSRVTAETVLLALGQAFFSIAIGAGAYITYGASLDRDVRLAPSSWIICLADLSIALLAGLAIFPIVFAAGLNPAEGPGLMFVILPVAFAQMPGGAIFGFLFFVLLFFAAFTTSIAMLEPIVSWLEEHRGFKRLQVAIASAAFAWLLGLACAFSFNIWENFTPLDGVPLMEGRTIFSIIDFTVATIMMPLNGILIALFAGWILPRRIMQAEVALQHEVWFKIWLVLIRYIAPVAVGTVFVFNFL